MNVQLFVELRLLDDRSREREATDLRLTFLAILEATTRMIVLLRLFDQQVIVELLRSDKRRIVKICCCEF